MRWILLAVMLGSVGAVSARAAERYDGHAVVRVHVDDAADLATLTGLQLQRWGDRAFADHVDVRVSPQQWPALAATGLRTTVLVADLQAGVDRERLRLASNPQTSHRDEFFADFRPLGQIEAHIATLAADNPAVAQRQQFGVSIEGRPLHALEISTAGPDAPVVLINAGQHAREWIAISTGVCIADELIVHADDPQIESLLGQVRFVVAPMINPDGYVFSWDFDRYWRKNRRGGYGVDTNRNFAEQWGGPGSNADPSADDFRGEAPFSEPETAALRDLAQSYGEDTRVAIDLHAYSQLVLYPWGYTTEPAPDDDVLAPLAEELAAAITAVNAAQHVAIPGADLYPAAGNAMDWFYGELGASAFTFELRPGQDDPFGFVVDPEQIDDTCVETLAAVLALAEYTAAEWGTPDDSGTASDTSGGTGDGGSSGGTVAGTSGATAGSGDVTGGEGGTGQLSAGTDAEVGTGEGQAGDGASSGCGCDVVERTGKSAALFGWILFGVGTRRRRALVRPRGQLPHATRQRDASGRPSSSVAVDSGN